MRDPRQTGHPLRRAGDQAPARGITLSDEVLRLIWRQRRISRAEIARRANLSRSTVSDIVNALLASGLVSEAGVGASRGGRRPIVLEFQDDAGVILGVDMGATHVAVALTDLRGTVLAWEHEEHPVRTDPVGTWALIVELCSRALAAWGGRRQHLVGIGVAVPSPVDPRHPERLSPLVLPEWQGETGFDRLRAEFGVPVLVDNDANLGALAEQWWGAGRGIDDFAYIKVATGIGSGHIISGRIYRGATGVMGEIGHLTIDPRGEPCVCGNRGCLATLVGSQALKERARHLLRKFPASALAGAEPTIAEIEDAAMAGDPLALQVVEEAAEYLGIAVAGMLNLMNPAAVILGAGLSRLGEQLLGPLRDTVLRRTFVSSVAASQIRTSELGPRGIAVGAATLMLDAALTDPSLFPTVGAR
jgi:predicted NBD/HSP70 family sugar kinase